MSYRRITAQAVAKRRRLQPSRFESTEEWRFLRADIDAGIPPDQALEVILTEADKEKFKIRNRRTVSRFVQKYITSNNLPYTLRSFHRDDEGDFFIVESRVPRAIDQSSHGRQPAPEGVLKAEDD